MSALFAGSRIASAAAPPAFSVAMPIPPVLTGQNITLVAQQADLQVFDGPKTRMWTFNGTFPGPTIRRPAGEPTTLTVVNDLGIPADDGGDITVHHHGAHAESSEDGQPHDMLIEPGTSRTYHYAMMEDGKPERAAFQWYHDHRMDWTARNVWMGLAGMFIVDDEVDQALPLPTGDYDVPMMVVDRKFDANNQIPYTFDANGVVGNTILVNGAPQPYFDVADRKYRLRILNASNQRDYDIAFSDGRAMTQVATESGLLPVPISRTHIKLGPAERAEIVVDFAGQLGQSVTLKNRLGFGSTADIMRFDVRTHVASDPSSVPPTLRDAPVFDAGPATKTRTWVLGETLEPGVRWTINGNGYEPSRDDTAPVDPVLGTTERWVFLNATAVDHLIHIHDVDWHIVGRYGGYPQDPDASVAENGLRESFRIRPGEVIEAVSRFTDHTGVFVIHCHILEHEDHSMMAQFVVQAPAGSGSGLARRAVLLPPDPAAAFRCRVRKIEA